MCWRKREIQQLVLSGLTEIGQGNTGQESITKSKDWSNTIFNVIPLDVFFFGVVGLSSDV